MAANGEANLGINIKETGKQALKDIASGFEEIKTQAAIASAAITAFIALSIKEYANAERVSNQLTAALVAQGLDVEKLTKKYTDLASALQKKSSFDDDSIKAGIALGQSMAGQLELTEDLIKSTLDFAAAKGMDLKSAFDLVGKSIGTETNALARYGIQLDASLTASEKMAAITEILTAKFQGAAEAQTKGLGAIQQARMALADFMELVGKQFAPTIEKAAKLATRFFESLQNDQTAKTVAIVSALAASFTGLVASVGAFVAFAPTLTAAFASIAAGVGAIAVPIATGISAIALPMTVLIATLAALNQAWTKNFLGFQDITRGTLGFIGQAIHEFSKQFGDIFKALFTFDVPLFAKSIKKLKTFYTDLKDHAVKEYHEGYKGREELAKQAIDEEKRAEKKLLEDKAKLQKQADENRKREHQRLLEEEQKQLSDFRYDWEKKKNEDANNQRIDMEIAYNQFIEQSNRERMQTLTQTIQNFTQNGLQGVASQFSSFVADSFIPMSGQAVGTIFNFLSQNTEQFKETLAKLFGPEFIDNILKNLITLVEQAPEIINRIVKYFADNMPSIVEAFIKAFVAALPNLTASLLKAFITTTADPRFYVSLTASIAKGFIGGFLEALGTIRDGIAKAVKDAFNIVGNIGKAVGVNTSSGIGRVGTAIATGGMSEVGRAVGIGLIGQDADWFSPNDNTPRTFEQKFRRVSLNQQEIDDLNRRLAFLATTPEYAKYGDGFLTAYQEMFTKNALSSGYYAHGGIIPAYAGGGLIDNKLVRAHAGEFVVNKDSASANMGLLDTINGSNGRAVSGGNNIVINVNGGLLGDRDSAKQLAKAIDEELYRLRQGNESRAFDRSVY